MNFLEFLIDENFNIRTPNGIKSLLNPKEAHESIAITDLDTNETDIILSNGSPLTKITLFNYSFVRDLMNEDKGHLRHFGARQTGTTTYALLYALYKGIVQDKGTVYMTFDNRALRNSQDMIRGILNASGKSSHVADKYIKFKSVSRYNTIRDSQSLRMYGNIIFDNCMYNTVSYDSLAYDDPSLKCHKDSKRIIEIVTG